MLIKYIEQIFVSNVIFPFVENEDDIRAFEDGYLAVLHLFLIPDLENLDDTISFLIRGLVLQMVE